MNNPPKILQVLPALQTGGAEKTAVDIGKVLVDKGWQSFVTSMGGRMEEDLKAGGSEHITLPLETRNPFKIWRNAARIERIIREHKIDLVHARSRAPAWSALWACRRTGVPYVTTYHGIYSQNNALKAWYNSIMARGDVVIANSKWTAKEVASRHPIAIGKITTIPRGTDFKNYKRDLVDKERRLRMRKRWGLPETAPKGEVLVLLLARLSLKKGQPSLIEAAAQLTRDFPNVRFVLAGDGRNKEGYIARLKSLIADQKLDDVVLLPGHCDDAAAAMAISDIVVSASTLPEAFGRSVTEAAALELPVIVTDIGTPPENILTPPEVSEDLRTGWIYSAGDSTQLANTLRTALELSPQKRKAMGKRARENALVNFSLEQMCVKTIKVYEDILGR